jgi:hypothetical protein
MSAITIIDLTNFVFDCAICEGHFEVPASLPTYGIARYEDEVVPDSYAGEWGGAPVCRKCYWIERGMHAQKPDSFIPFSEIKAIAKGR